MLEQLESVGKNLLFILRDVECDSGPLNRKVP